MQKLNVLLLSILVLFGLVGCQTHEDRGTLAGAVIGGLVGSQFGSGSGKALAIVGGALAGTYLGNQIGKSMDKVDRMNMNNALESAPTGRSVAWTNPDSGNYYVVKPVKTYQRRDHGTSRPCREYVTTATVGGKKQEVYGTACRMDDGSWKIVK